MEANSLKVTELQVLEGDDEGGPGGQVDEAAGGGLQEDGLSVRNSLKLLNIKVRSCDASYLSRSVLTAK